MTSLDALEATVTNQTYQIGKLGKGLLPVAASILGGCLLPVLVLIHMILHTNPTSFILKKVLGSFINSI